MKDEKKPAQSPALRPAQKRAHRKTAFSHLAEMFAPYTPDLRKKLVLADMRDSQVEFLEKVVGSAIYVSLILLVLTAIFLDQMKLPLWYLIIPIIVYPVVLFRYFLLIPEVAILRRQKSIDYEIVFAGRHLVIALRSGMPLFDAMRGVTVGYGAVSMEFNKIVERVTLGTPMSQAIREVAQNNPSKNFVRIIMQITNSLSSGANVADSLDAVLDQISKEQAIELKEYGQKLTPMVMFYMIFGIILPSLGISFMIILFSLISSGKFGLNSSILFFAFLFIAIVQFLFLAMVESSRPKYVL